MASYDIEGPLKSLCGLLPAAGSFSRRALSSLGKAADDPDLRNAILAELAAFAFNPASLFALALEDADPADPWTFGDTDLKQESRDTTAAVAAVEELKRELIASGSLPVAADPATREAAIQEFRRALVRPKTVIPGLEFAARVNREIGQGAADAGEPVVPFVFITNVDPRKLERLERRLCRRSRPERATGRRERLGEPAARVLAPDSPAIAEQSRKAPSPKRAVQRRRRWQRSTSPGFGPSPLLRPVSRCRIDNAKTACGQLVSLLSANGLRWH
jgi:hypothetical protein